MYCGESDVGKKTKLYQHYDEGKDLNIIIMIGKATKRQQLKTECFKMVFKYQSG